MKERNKRIAYGVLGVLIFVGSWVAEARFT